MSWFCSIDPKAEHRRTESVMVIYLTQSVNPGEYAVDRGRVAGVFLLSREHKTDELQMAQS